MQRFYMFYMTIAPNPFCSAKVCDFFRFSASFPPPPQRLFALDRFLATSVFEYGSTSTFSFGGDRAWVEERVEVPRGDAVLFFGAGAEAVAEGAEMFEAPGETRVEPSLATISKLNRLVSPSSSAAFAGWILNGSKVRLLLLLTGGVREGGRIDDATVRTEIVNSLLFTLGGGGVVEVCKADTKAVKRIRILKRRSISTEKLLAIPFWGIILIWWMQLVCGSEQRLQNFGD